MKFQTDNKKANMTTLLQRSRLFENFTAKEISSMVSVCDPEIKKYKSGEVILKEMQIPERIYLILRGTMSGIRKTHCGQGHELCFRHEGDTVGLFALFSEDRRTFVEISAFDNVEVLSFNINTLLKDTDIKSRIYASACEELVRQTRYDIKRMDALLSENSSERVEIFIRDNIDDDNIINFELSQEKTAHYLNINRTTFSKELSSLRKNGKIEALSKRKYIYHGCLEETI